MGGFSFSIDVSVWDTFGNATERLENDLNAKSNNFKNFVLLDRSSDLFQDFEGEQITYSCEVYKYIFDEDGEILESYSKDYEGIPVYVTDIYFDHDGYYWDISFESPIESYETNQREFEHILKTFKILD
ncbi:MAG: hypothetical protein JW712_01800 [Dehalococcoidales bacterium]|nr:hypothetical protein [Dehalococcoidales bacterium]